MNMNISPTAALKLLPDYFVDALVRLEELRSLNALSRCDFFRDTLRSDTKSLNEFWIRFNKCLKNDVEANYKSVSMSLRSVLSKVLQEMRQSWPVNFDDKNMERCYRSFLLHHQILREVYGDLDRIDLQRSVKLFRKVWQSEILSFLTRQLLLMKHNFLQSGVPRRCWSDAYSLELYGTLNVSVHQCFQLWSGLMSQLYDETFDHIKAGRFNGRLEEWCSHCASAKLEPNSIRHPNFPGWRIFTVEDKVMKSSL